MGQAYPYPVAAAFHPSGEGAVVDEGASQRFEPADLLQHPGLQQDTAARSGGHEGLELWEKPPGGAWQSRGLVVTRQERFSGYTGMSNDMAAAIAEGATVVRIGSAIFGPR